MDERTKGIKSAAEKEKDLAYYEGEDKVIKAADLKAEIDANNLAPVVRMQSGIPDLDKAIKGFQGGELITISGPTKNGKTSLAHLFTKNFEDQGFASLWFSFEVTPAQMFEKFALTQEFYLPRKLKQKSMEWIEDRIIEAKAKFNVRAVFIDHLHYIVDMEKMNHSSSLEIGSVVRRLKSIAVDLNVSVFLMAHMSKTKYDEMPNEEGLRDSSFITQESDKTLLVWRERKKDRRTRQFDFSGRTALIVSNDRREGVMGKIIYLQFDNNQLKPYEDGYDVELKKATGDAPLPDFG